jgi:hypothetical protein
VPAWRPLVTHMSRQLSTHAQERHHCGVLLSAGPACCAVHHLWTPGRSAAAGCCCCCCQQLRSFLPCLPPACLHLH